MPLYARIKSNMRFAGKVAIICGGADGIGQAAAGLMAAEGAQIAIADIASERLRSILEAIHVRGEDGLAIETNALDEKSVSAMVEKVLGRFGRIDILVNSVGGSTTLKNPNTKLDDFTAEDWDRTIEFNLRGSFLCTRAVIPQMKKQRYGRIVNLSSIMARGDTALSNAAYATAKAGIRAFTRKLAVELGPFGITCNATAPGITLTDRIQRMIAARPATDPKTSVNDIPLGRMSTADDQAKVIAFLASDDAAFVSGQTIEVTGGQ
jgi:NAD(P)-dependent dehydrogenase (short-subunit alcohol dehydrogenase family)